MVAPGPAYAGYAKQVAFAGWTRVAVCPTG